MASSRPADFEAAQREFNDRQMLPELPIRRQPKKE
jgi:hypothetical protein